MLSVFAAEVVLAHVHYFTCRHNYLPALHSELGRCGFTVITSPCEGLARVESDDTEPSMMDPTYALQYLPYAHEVSGSSIKQLASAALGALDADALQCLEGLPRGALRIHTVVPDLLRGVPAGKAKLLRRCDGIADLVSEGLRKRFPAARKRSETARHDASADDEPSAVLQLVLLEPERLVVSLATSAPPANGLGYWPARMRAGLTETTVDGDMPSSAYRKLLEAFAYVGGPEAGSTCVDLGACPGGWTAALRRRGCSVTAVDRSPLDPTLMADPDVTFCQGDAFTFTPDSPVAWAVSDVIAFPERCIELLERWCGSGWADRMVFTMKFTGDAPDFDAIDAAAEVARGHDYQFRSKHFFANKNEVTLMLSRN